MSTTDTSPTLQLIRQHEGLVNLTPQDVFEAFEVLRAELAQTTQLAEIVANQTPDGAARDRARFVSSLLSVALKTAERRSEKASAKQANARPNFTVVK